MSYTPHTWQTGETITAAKLNNIEEGISEAAQSGGGGYDAVIRLTHSNDSGADTPANLTPSIISGSFSQLYAMLEDTKVPNILVEYYHPFGMSITLTPYISYYNDGNIFMFITGYLPANEQFNVIGIPLVWGSNDAIAWND